MKRLIKESLRAIAIGIIVFVVLLFVAMARGKAFTWNSYLLVNFFYVMLYSLALYLVNSYIFDFFDKAFGKVIMSAKRIVLGFFTSFSASVLVMFLLRMFEDMLIEGRGFGEFIASEKLANYYTAALITFVVTVVIHAFYFYKRYQENRLKEQKIIAGTASAKFETLKNQIDPHFLFNSLNVLSSLIEENPESAQRFTTSLSKVYRYVLEQKDKELVSIEEELSFAKTYMNLLKMRFENSVFYELPENISNPDARVVPLSLQLLLENTVKHNIVSQQKPLRIRIFEEDGYLVVQNDFQKKEVLQDRQGVGLQNIISRYAIITARKVQIEQTGKYFTVKLPVLTKQLSIMETNYNESESNYYKAKKRVDDIKGFYGNLFSYIAFMGGLAILNLLTYSDYLWFIYPAIGWGIGVVVHFISVFNIMPFLGRDWEERKIQEFLDKEKTNKWK